MDNVEDVVEQTGCNLADGLDEYETLYITGHDGVEYRSTAIAQVKRDRGRDSTKIKVEDSPLAKM